MSWKPFDNEGEPLDLGHLNDFEYSLVIPPKDGKPKQTYRLNVIFSLHCFTRAPKRDEQIPPHLAYSDHRETRIFDHDRYDLSFQLPAVIRELAERKCYHDRYGNFYVIELIDENGVTRYYSIYFTLSKAGRKRGLNLYVSSAHARDRLPYEKNTKPIRFRVLVYNVWHRRPVKPAQ